MLSEILRVLHLHMPAQQVGMAYMLAVAGFAAVRGERPERAGAAMMLAAWVLTPFAVDLAPPALDAAAVLAMDAALLAGVLALALFGHRYWPMAAAGLHLIGTALHLAAFVDPQVALRERIVATYIFSYLTVLALAVGTALEAPRRGEARPSP